MPQPNSTQQTDAFAEGRAAVVSKLSDVMNNIRALSATNERTLLVNIEARTRSNVTRCLTLIVYGQAGQDHTTFALRSVDSVCRDEDVIGVDSVVRSIELPLIESLIKAISVVHYETQ